MNKILFLCVLVLSALACLAQTPIDHFNVGPYVVDYNGDGDVKYRLRDNIDLYEYFELQKDTTVISMVVEEPVKNAVLIAGRVGANRYASKEFVLEGLWKRGLKDNLYFNGGVSLAIGHTNCGSLLKRNMLEVGVPLQIELGKLNHQYASLYGLVGVTPTFYTTTKAEKWDNAADAKVGDIEKSGFLVAPVLEFGGNIPVGAVVMRIGVYATYKINCTTGDYDVYENGAGKAFFGAKIGIVL